MVRALDTTDTTQIIVSLQEWINSLSILDDKLYLEYQNGNFGYCIKSDGGAVLEEDILGNFTAEVPFLIFFTTCAVPDSSGEIFKPLNNLIAWFRANGTAGLDIGARRTPQRITSTRSPADLSGKDEDGNTTFFAVFSLTYDEEAK